jgi:hypothetical protein
MINAHKTLVENLKGKYYLQCKIKIDIDEIQPEVSDLVSLPRTGSNVGIL